MARPTRREDYVDGFIKFTIFFMYTIFTLVLGNFECHIRRNDETYAEDVPFSEVGETDTT